MISEVGAMGGRGGEKGRRDTDSLLRAYASPMEKQTV